MTMLFWPSQSSGTDPGRMLCVWRFRWFFHIDGAISSLHPWTTHLCLCSPGLSTSWTVLAAWLGFGSMAGGEVRERTFRMFTHFRRLPGKQFTQARFSLQHLHETQRALSPLHLQHKGIALDGGSSVRNAVHDSGDGK